METVFGIAGVGVGALITFLCSRYYYMKAARELSVIARGLEEALSLEYTRGKSGNLSGIRLSRTATARARIATKPNAEVTPPKT